MNKVQQLASTITQIGSPLSVALFANPNDGQARLVGESLEELGNSIQFISNISELRYLEDVQFFTFETILFGNGFGESVDRLIAVIRELRSQTDLADMPLIVLSDGSRGRHHAYLYDAGADLILSHSTPPQDVLLAFHNLLKKRDEKRRLHESAKFTLDSEVAIFQTLSISPEAIVVVTPTGDVRWINDQGESVLGLHHASEQGRSQYFAYLSGVLRNSELFSKAEGAPLRPVALDTYDGVNDWWDIEA
ncbi:MAG: hypothetical protein KDD70_13765, partial [Bdellovibrionales bacterium]|nr:hypothetical protein [Bdellovibrionales bacterium]